MDNAGEGWADWRDADGDALLRKLMADGCPYGAAFMDLDGRITGWSRGASALTGHAADEVMGSDFALLFTPEDAARKLPEHELNTVKALGVAEDERWHLRKDGSRFWASGMTFLLNANANAGGESYGCVKLFRDATPLRLKMDWLENELQRMRKERNDRDAFLATIAHELRNPLQPMHLATQLLTHPSEETRHEQALKILARQLGFLERLVEDLVDLVRMGRSQLRVDYAKVELQRLVQDAVDSCREQAAAKAVALTCVMPPVPIPVEVDPARITQVIVNLVNNAIKFTPSGGKVAVWASADEAQLIVKVQDNGCGIAPRLQPKIFDMFTQADGADTHRGQGLGIGLALVKEIVSLHRGTVEVRSEGLGRGSEFFIRLPLARPAETPPPAGPR